MRYKMEINRKEFECLLGRISSVLEDYKTIEITIISQAFEVGKLICGVSDITT